MGGKGQLGHRALRDEPAGSVLAVSPPVHRQQSAGSGRCSDGCYRTARSDMSFCRSPAGISLGALVYNYDGNVFASDEGRMLAQIGDRTLELGDLQTDDYRSLILSDKLVSLIGNTLATMRTAMRLMRL
jgi:hypothetical protein